MSINLATYQVGFGRYRNRGCPNTLLRVGLVFAFSKASRLIVHRTASGERRYDLVDL